MLDILKRLVLAFMIFFVSVNVQAESKKFNMVFVPASEKGDESDYKSLISIVEKLTEFEINTIKVTDYNAFTYKEKPRINIVKPFKVNQEEERIKRALKTGRLTPIEQRTDTGQQLGGIDREGALDNPSTDRDRAETTLGGGDLQQDSHQPRVRIDEIDRYEEDPAGANRPERGLHPRQRAGEIRPAVGDRLHRKPSSAQALEGGAEPC